MTYSHTKFEVAISNGLGGDTFTRNVTDGRTHGRTDGRRTDFNTKLIYPFFLKKKAGIKKKDIFCEIWVLTHSFFRMPFRSHYSIFSPQSLQEYCLTYCSMKRQKIFTHQNRSLISRLVCVPISPTFCRQYSITFPGVQDRKLENDIAAYHLGPVYTFTGFNCYITNPAKRVPRLEKTCLWRCVNNKGAEQPACMGSLISTFLIHILKSTISKLAISKISIF